MQYNEWSLDYRPGGWIRARDETGVTVFFGVDLIRGAALPRVRVTVMHSPTEPISARSWRSAPFRGVEQHAAIPAIRDLLAKPPEFDGIDGLGEYFDRTQSQYGDMHGFVPTTELVADPGEPPAGFSVAALLADKQNPSSDEHLENVARIYRWAVASGLAPAPLIARYAHVPVSRVHRWVATARKRGFLPPAVKGRAG